MMTIVIDVSFRPEEYTHDVTAYGSRLCRLLALDENSVHYTVFNAETYKIFATGVTLNRVNWYPAGYWENTGLGDKWW